MPKLMLFVACEKAIIDKDNNLSLISLFSELKAEISEAEITAAIPSEQKAMIPLRWDAVSMWLRAEGDDDGEREYEQRISLLDPSGEATGLGASTTWKFGDNTTVRNVVRMMGFPIYPSGRYVLKLWMQEKRHAEAAEPVAEHAITLKLGEPKA